MGKTLEHMGNFPSSWVIGRKRKLDVGRRVETGKIRWSVGPAPLPPIRNTSSEDRSLWEITHATTPEIQRKKQVPLPPIRRDSRETARQPKDNSLTVVSDIYKKLRPLIEELTGCVLGTTTADHRKTNQREKAITLAHTLEAGKMATEAVAEHPDYKPEEDGTVHRRVRMITAQRALILLSKIHEAFSREVDLQHCEYDNICQAIRKLHWCRPGLISLLIGSRKSSKPNQKTKLPRPRDQLISNRHNELPPLNRPSLDLSAPHIRTMAADGRTTIPQRQEGYADDPSLYRDHVNKREMVKTHMATIPRRGQIKVTAMDYEMDNPEFHKIHQGEPPVGEKKQRRRRVKPGKSYLINRPEIVDQIKIGDRLLAEESHKVPHREDGEDLSSYTVRDLTSLLNFTAQVAGKKTSPLTHMLSQEIRATISPIVQRAVFTSTTAPQSSHPHGQRQKPDGPREFSQAIANMPSQTHIMVPGDTPVVPRQTPAILGQTSGMLTQTPGLPAHTPGVPSHSPATPGHTPAAYFLTPVIYNLPHPSYATTPSASGMAQNLDPQEEILTINSSNTNVIPEEPVTGKKQQGTQNKRQPHPLTHQPKKPILTPTACTIEPVILTTTSVTRDFHVPVWNNKR